MELDSNSEEPRSLETILLLSTERSLTYLALGKELQRHDSHGRQTHTRDLFDATLALIQRWRSSAASAKLGMLPLDLGQVETTLVMLKFKLIVTS